MAKKKKKPAKKEKQKPADEVVYRCNLCDRVDTVKECCGDDFTKQTRLIEG